MRCRRGDSRVRGTAFQWKVPGLRGLKESGCTEQSWNLF